MVYRGNYESDVAQALTDMTLKANLYSLNKDIVDYDTPSEINYRNIFTIEDHERMTYSYTSTDEGVMTIYGAIPNIFRSMSGINTESLNKYIWAYNKELIGHLGVRVMTGNTWAFLKGPAETQAFCALTLNRTNAEARNCNIKTIPKFGLMVNRPIFWREKNYMACVTSVQHSIVWGRSISTTVNINQIRGWAGEIDEHSGKPKYRHFGDTNRPFNLAEFMKQNNKDREKKK